MKYGAVRKFFRQITLRKLKVNIGVNFLISFVAAARTVVVQLITFLFYWSGAKIIF